MTTWIKHFRQVNTEDRSCLGGKCYALAALARAGFLIPEGTCIGFDAYKRFVAESKLSERIHFELGRKKFEDMRWEELWDLSLRIRNMFINSRFPTDLKAELKEALEATFGDEPVVVRSSAAGEDSRDRSFAGLHESYVNIRGTESILNHIKLVWASLWSDRALLYRQELGLSAENSVMGVVVQKLVAGQVSGVAFSQSPESPDDALIEAVYGLNQGLVDGTVEPDHWVVDRESGAVLSHRPASRMEVMMPGVEGLELVSLDGADTQRPPLDEKKLTAVLEMAMRAETAFGSPQDVEWTYAGENLYTLQSRPITTLKHGRKEDERAWYLTLTRSFENLKILRKRIEEDIIPGMDEEARNLEGANLDRLSEAELSAEIYRRSKILDRWTKAYWADCIPFAHGMRLFGQVYNDMMRPKDPYEFMELLSGESTLGLERNRMLEAMADMASSTPALARLLKENKGLDVYPRFKALLDAFIDKYGAISRAGAEEPPPQEAHRKIIGLVLEMARRSSARKEVPVRDRERLVSDFLSKFLGPREQVGKDLFDLARASYRWRDDDNIYLARIEAETARAVALGRQRLAARLGIEAGGITVEDVSHALRDPQYRPVVQVQPEEKPTADRQFSLRPRQLTGLPAGPGIGTGPAKVVMHSDDLYGFKSGEVLVCDAIEPEMTLVVPMAAGIVERRGGMLIHGAIVAREYSIPCVTGVPNAAVLIHSGDKVTVDGYLGIVIIEEDQSQ
jgi:phosphohistidine swiveling domain-containing protein